MTLRREDVFGDGHPVLVEYVDEDGVPISDEDWHKYAWVDVTTISDGFYVRRFTRFKADDDVHA